MRLSYLKLNARIILTLIIFTAFLIEEYEKNNSGDNQSYLSIIDKLLGYIENNAPSFAKVRNRLILLLDFNDFNCPPCFDDFISLCDKINNVFGKDSQEHIVAVFRQRDIAILKDSEKLLYWKKINNINFVTLVGPDSIFESIKFIKSMAIVLDNRNKIIFSEYFPMGERKHNNIIKLLGEK